MTELLSSLNWFAIVTATLLYFFLGALWYSPLLFANAWMELRNIKEEEVDQPNPVIFIYALILQLIAVITLALFMTAVGVATATHGLIIGFGAGAGILFTASGITGIFSDIPLKLHMIDYGYHVIGLSLAGLILGWW